MPAEKNKVETSKKLHPTLEKLGITLKEVEAQVSAWDLGNNPKSYITLELYIKSIDNEKKETYGKQKVTFSESELLNILRY